MHISILFESVQIMTHHAMFRYKNRLSHLLCEPYTSIIEVYNYVTLKQKNG